METQPCNVLPHVILLSFPAQGHISPLLRLGKIFASKGMMVTLTAPNKDGIAEKIRISDKTISSEEPTSYGDGKIRFEFFADEAQGITVPEQYMENLERIGKRKLTEMIRESAEQGRPVCCLIYSCFIPWVADLGESLGIPSAPLWVQSAASFSAYYHYHHKLVPFPTESEPELDVQLPCMPVLKPYEIPSFLHPQSQFPALTDSILSIFKNLNKNCCVLMESFQELESEVINYMSKLCPIKPIGPLFLYSTNIASTSSANVSVNGYITDDCKEWLDSKPANSVVYVSFGSGDGVKPEQGDELAYGLLNSGVSFLWVIRPPKSDLLPKGFLEKAGEKGKIVQWSNQKQVLDHPSVACFLTHCGWNSTMETLSSGVPVLCFPIMGEQVTDAKYLVDEFRVGLRLSRGDFDKTIITRDEIEKCLREATAGPKAAELKQNAMKYKKAAEDAVAEGGSSHLTLLEFLDELKVEVPGEVKSTAKENTV
ncbi:OLC1v1031100C1 [Oldenlandia corymbosa var. corymbosa]|uniref:Glycosyltransferase n=1 Tax=Oldenlandia corymbosa var. corymbosa TaxID=529605 RepID=A0AAV1CJK0_OLDCO|nr:OLC1v1031100C1 [Oldenlandia corymbosa var. corymbosa]